jgi:virulence-associated protein VapD
MRENDKNKSRKQIDFDLDQKELEKNYPRPKLTMNPQFYKRAYSDISNFMRENGFEHRQYSVYTSHSALTAYDVITLMEKLATTMPWLYVCVNQIDVTDISEQHSLLYVLAETAKNFGVAIEKNAKNDGNLTSDKVAAKLSREYSLDNSPPDN